MIKGIQILGIMIGLYLLASTLYAHKKGEMGIRRTVFWSLVWTGMTALFYNTQLVSVIMPVLTTQDSIMTALVGGILTAFLYINQVNRQLAQLDKKVTTLTQNLALENYMIQEKSQNEQ